MFIVNMFRMIMVVRGERRWRMIVVIRVIVMRVIMMIWVVMIAGLMRGVIVPGMNIVPGITRAHRVIVTCMIAVNIDCRVRMAMTIIAASNGGPQSLAFREHEI